jgi:hypothetical protein
MKKKIKLAFSDFWEGFDYNPTGKENSTIPSKSSNFFYCMLSEVFDIEISNNPDYLIYSVFGNNHYSYKNCKKIFFTGESIRPNLSYCDYAITFDYLDNDRCLRFPLSAVVMYENNIFSTFEKNINFEEIKKEKTKFCNFVFSNPAPQSPRNFLFLELSKYKTVDAGGNVYNNLGKLVEPGWDNKMKFQNQYKFTICFENSEYPGYTTEKIIHPKIVNSIPIYWGNPLVGNDWNTKSFINAYDFKNIFDLIEYIKDVDNNDELYYSILKEPHFNDGISNDLNYKSLINFFEKIIK